MASVSKFVDDANYEPDYHMSMRSLATRRIILAERRQCLAEIKAAHKIKGAKIAWAMWCTSQLLQPPVDIIKPECDPLIIAIKHLLANRTLCPNGKWSGTVTELFGQLRNTKEHIFKSNACPHNPALLGRRLSLLKQSLRDTGINIHNYRSADVMRERRITITDHAQKEKYDD